MGCVGGNRRPWRIRLRGVWNSGIESSGMDLGIQVKRALITGSTSGIGAATANMLAQEGVKVIINGRNADRAEVVKAAIEGAGGTAAIALGDLSDDASAAEVMKAAIEAFGGIDILVNNLGQYEPFAPVWTDATPEQRSEEHTSELQSLMRISY